MALRSAADKLSSLRALLKARGWAAYVVGTSDAHNSEYVSTHDARCVVLYLTEWVQPAPRAPHNAPAHSPPVCLSPPQARVPHRLYG